jgi:EAL domain-containing protein (putative c-di-GMP-specific phosphodiesterase class I)/FixJ family two-component response regulator
MTTSHKILVIDDEKEVGRFICDVTEGMALSCVATTDQATFFEQLTPSTTLILLDLVMPDTDGVEILRKLANQHCKVGIVLMSGIGRRVIESAEKFATSLGLNIVGSLHKPFRIGDLEEVVNRQIATLVHPAARPKPQLILSDDELIEAIEQNHFVVHYQPQIEIATSKLVGVEALVRLLHPTRGLIFPDLFIDRSLEELHHAVAADGTLPTLSINISVHSLYDVSFTDKFVAHLVKHNFPPQGIVLEITESGLIREMPSALDVLTRLRMKQVRLSIDDFGTGYAMMQQLRLVPATEIKIDRSFVLNMHRNNSDRVMVQKTIEIGHELGMRVIAEGVETLEQLEFLRSAGCDIAQGYYFSRPIPLLQLSAWIQNHETS